MMKDFSVDADTYVLKSNRKDREAPKSVLATGRHYEIPVFQRPYSWGEDQIVKFIKDILVSFWGHDQSVNPQPIFMGTMQIAPKEEVSNFNVIDGQQRLTTLLLLLKCLKTRFVIEELSHISLDWLSTKVNKQYQQELLSKALTETIQHKSIEDSTKKIENRYSVNYTIINQLIEAAFPTDENDQSNSDFQEFIGHLLNNVYFVVIETKATLSKTLDIFNAINTTGLNLAGSDIFKIRLFDYLTVHKKYDEDVFNEIDALYHKVDIVNESIGYKITDFGEILWIYQYWLIAKYQLPNDLHSLSTDSFYERLFDSLMGVNDWKGFTKVNDVEISIAEISRLIDIRFEWNELRKRSALNCCSLHLIWWSRYRNYWILPILLMMKKNLECQSEAAILLKNLSKLYLIYSIRYLKAVSEIITFTFSLCRNLVNGDFAKANARILEKIGEHHNSIVIQTRLEGDITANAKAKNLICRLSAMLEEDYLTTSINRVDLIEDLLFVRKMDVEHMESFNDQDLKIRDQKISEWGDDLNSLGNLTLLERSINRRMSNRPYIHKISVENGYKESELQIIKNQVSQHKTWNLAFCKIKKQERKNEIFKYLFNTSS